MKMLSVVSILVLGATLVHCSLESQDSSYYLQPSTTNFLPPQHQPASFNGAIRKRFSNRYVPTSSSLYQAPPSTSYGVPDFNADYEGYDYSRQNYQDEQSEPAKYNFGYRVNDNFGNDYGHQETRDGAKTRGSYFVLLPDGRKQIVEYEADENGFRPKITYEEASVSRAYGQPPVGRAAYPGASY